MRAAIEMSHDPRNEQREPAADPRDDVFAASLGPLRENARRAEGLTRRGRPCSLVDNSGDALPEAELRSLLQALIDSDAFGFRPVSASGGHTLSPDAPRVAPVQVGDRLYRLFVLRHAARLEAF